MKVLFHSFTREELQERIEQAWDMDGLFPLPKFEPRCPQCREPAARIRGFSYGNRKGSPNPFRCDVQFKCTVCSMAWTHGVPIPESLYRGRPISWREAKTEIDVLRNPRVELLVPQDRLGDKDHWGLIKGERAVGHRETLGGAIVAGLASAALAVGQPNRERGEGYIIVARLGAA